MVSFIDVKFINCCAYVIVVVVVVASVVSRRWSFILRRIGTFGRYGRFAVVK